MAERLARIYGTEEDKVNCPFYFKIGTCRHGDRCSRQHNRPLISQTLLLPHLYQNPPAAVAVAEGQPVDEQSLKEAARHFEYFYEEVFLELAKFGEVEEMHVCDNIGDHMVGNVYAKFASEDDAAAALKGLNGRFYAGRPIVVEFCPVTDFRQARCRQFDETTCSRMGYCNYVHLKYVSRSLKRDVLNLMFEEHPDYLRRQKDRPRERSRSRSRSRGRGGRRDDRGPPRRDDRDRGDRSDRGGGSGRDRDRDRDRDRGGRDDRDRRRSRSRSRSRDRGSRDGGNGHGNGADRMGRQSSEERRAMIEQWNRQSEAVSTGAGAGVADPAAAGPTA